MAPSIVTDSGTEDEEPSPTSNIQLSLPMTRSTKTTILYQQQPQLHQESIRCFEDMLPLSLKSQLREQSIGFNAQEILFLAIASFFIHASSGQMANHWNISVRRIILW